MIGKELGWVLGADCPHCDQFTPAVPRPSTTWQWVMYCSCGVVFVTRNTYSRRELDIDRDARAHLERIGSEAEREEAPY